MHPPTFLLPFIPSCLTLQVPRPHRCWRTTAEMSALAVSCYPGAQIVVHFLPVLLSDHLVVLYCNSPTTRSFARSLIHLPSSRTRSVQNALPLPVVILGTGGVGSAAKPAVRRTARFSVLGRAAFPFPASNICFCLLDYQRDWQLDHSGTLSLCETLLLPLGTPAARPMRHCL
jgi:hypothetical protein